MILVKATYRDNETRDTFSRYIGFDTYRASVKTIIRRIETALENRKRLFDETPERIDFCVVCAHSFFMNIFLPYTPDNIREVFGGLANKAD